MFFGNTQDLHLVQNILECTRFREGCKPSKLDYVFTDEENLVDNLQYQSPLGKSDHVCLTWDLTVLRQIDTATNTTKRNYWKGDYTKINSELNNTNWLEILGTGSVDSMWTAFRDKILQLVDEHVPFTSGTTKYRKNGISKATIRKIKQRNELWNDYREYPSDDKFKRYKETRNKVNKLVRQDHATHQNKILQELSVIRKDFMPI